jgi:uncharacterized membrane protein
VTRDDDDDDDDNNNNNNNNRILLGIWMLVSHVYVLCCAV